MPNLAEGMAANIADLPNKHDSEPFLAHCLDAQRTINYEADIGQITEDERKMLTHLLAQVMRGREPATP